MTYKNTIISLIMIAVAGTAVWITLSYKPQHAALAQINTLPDARMEDVIAVTMDKQGKPRMKIVTPKLTHYAQNDTTHFISPQLTLYRKSPQPWFITANFAKSMQGAEQVNFWDEVIIQHAADQNNPATIIKTSTLTVYPNKQTAETNDPIVMMQPNTTVKATGMFADMNTGDIKLLSQARGEYVPN